MESETLLAGTAHTPAYKHLLARLIEAREAAGMSQAQLAEILGKPASFVGKYELGERRLDVVELLVVLRALKTDQLAFLSEMDDQLPESL